MTQKSILNFNDQNKEIQAKCQCFQEGICNGEILNTNGSVLTGSCFECWRYEANDFTMLDKHIYSGDEYY